MKERLSVVVVLTLLSSFCWAGVVPVTTEYFGEVNGYYRVGYEIYSLHDTTINGRADAWTPYRGGSAIYRPSEMSDQAVGIGSIFPHLNPGVEGWTNGHIEGTLSIGHNSNYPVGSDLLLEIDYTILGRNNPEAYFYRKTAAIIDQSSYSFIWFANHGAGDMTERYTIPVEAGESYILWMSQTVGTQYSPVTGGDIGASIRLDFNVVPEPLTLLLLGLGGVLLRGKK